MTEDILGGSFIPAPDDQSLLLKIKEGEQADFWKKVFVKVTADGSQAVLQTYEDTFIIALQESEEAGLLTHCRIPYLSGKSQRIFQRKESDFLFANRNENANKI